LDRSAEALRYPKALRDPKAHTMKRGCMGVAAVKCMAMKSTPSKGEWPETNFSMHFITR